MGFAFREISPSVQWAIHQLYLCLELSVNRFFIENRFLIFHYYEKVPVSLVSLTSFARLSKRYSDIILKKSLFSIQMVSVANLLDSYLYQSVVSSAKLRLSSRGGK